MGVCCLCPCLQFAYLQYVCLYAVGIQMSCLCCSLEQQAVSLLSVHVKDVTLLWNMQWQVHGSNISLLNSGNNFNKSFLLLHEVWLYGSNFQFKGAVTKEGHRRPFVMICQKYDGFELSISSQRKIEHFILAVFHFESLPSRPLRVVFRTWKQPPLRSKQSIALAQQSPSMRRPQFFFPRSQYCAALQNRPIKKLD